MAAWDMADIMTELAEKAHILTDYKANGAGKVYN